MAAPKKFIQGQRSGTGHDKRRETGEVEKVTLVAWRAKLGPPRSR
jgi:hypothetical protein